MTRPKKKDNTQRLNVYSEVRFYFGVMPNMFIPHGFRRNHFKHQKDILV